MHRTPVLLAIACAVVMFLTYRTALWFSGRSALLTHKKTVGACYGLTDRIIEFGGALPRIDEPSGAEARLAACRASWPGCEGASFARATEIARIVCSGGTKWCPVVDGWGNDLFCGIARDSTDFVVVSLGKDRKAGPVFQDLYDFQQSAPDVVLSWKRGVLLGPEGISRR